MHPYQILLAEDHVLFREAIKKAINGTPGLEVTGEASDGRELLDLLKTSVPDLIILDISMPNLSGLEAAKLIKDNYPQVKILILSMHKSIGHIKGAFEVKVDGYLLKENAYGDLITAIDVIKSGSIYISPLIHGQIKDFIQHGTQQVQAKPLSSRETEVLSLLSSGLTYKDIAQHLSISSATVQTYLHNIKAKLHIKDVSGLIEYAKRQGLEVMD
jgi:DNA-binding NarL/FixJ family response regulator